MVVLHIVLWILKAVGILLLFLLALVVLLVLAVLFSPVRYNARVQKEEEYYEGEAGISWLSHLVSVKLRFGNREGAGGYSVRLLGFPVSRAAAFFSGRKEKSKGMSLSGKKVRRNSRKRPKKNPGKKLKRKFRRR